MNKIFKTIFIITLAIMTLGMLNSIMINKQKELNRVEYSVFVDKVKEGKIKKATIVEKGRGVRDIKAVDAEGKNIITLAPADTSLVEKLLSNSVQTTAEEEETNWVLSVFVSWFPMLLLIGVWIWFMKKQSGGGKGGIFGVGKSKITMVEKNKNNVKFDDVIGCEEAKEEVKEVVDFLKNPEKFSKLGAKLPKGVLFTGPAGTGKTMLAKAIAHEADVPFFTTSGSSFVEMFVGVGAARVRDMFEDAKKHAPCIVFIDEIDALGGKRSSNGQGNEEREQTLNQLLVEMDGVEGNNGVIIIGATNRPDMLDPALLRPGRLDRQVVVALPDVKGRDQILRLYAKNVPISTNLDISKIARGTPGFSGAELANLVNEAAIFASRRNKKFVDYKDFEDAKDKIIMGPERRSMVMPEKEKLNTAYHESGHAVVAKLIPECDPVHKVTVVPRGRALGVTMQLPEQDKYAHDKQHLLDQIAVLMGGRLAEEIFCKHMTTGASNDIERATSLARRMVTEWGMSDTLGPLCYGDKVSGGFLGGGYSNMQDLAAETRLEIDKEIRAIVMGQYNRAKDLLESNKDKVEAMTAALMDVETIDDWQINNIMAGVHFNSNHEIHEAEKKKEEELHKSINSGVEEVKEVVKTDVATNV